MSKFILEKCLLTIHMSLSNGVNGRVIDIIQHNTNELL